MGMFDPWVIGQHGGGLLGGWGGGPDQSDIDALIKAYGPRRDIWSGLPQPDAPQVPMDPSGSTPMGSAPPNPYGSPSGLMPTFGATVSTEGAPQPQQQSGGPLLKPGSILDRIFNAPSATFGGGGQANAAPNGSAPNMSGAEPSAAWSGPGSGAEPSAVWGGAVPQTASVPMPRPRPQGLGAMPPQPAAPGPPMQTTPQTPQLPPAAQNAQAAYQPMSQQQQPPSSSFRDKMAQIAGILDPSQRGQLTEIGSDPFTGQKQFATYNPVTNKMSSVGGDGQQVSNNVGMGAFAEAVRAGVGGQALLGMAPPEIKNRLQAMLAGREAPPTGAALRNPQTQALLNAAHAIDPTFDETSWGKRFALIKNYEAGGKQFQEVQAINTVAGHLGNLMKSADALNNTSIPIVNGVMNWIRQNTGDPRIDRLNTDIQAVTTELSKAYKAGHVSDADVRLWRENINSAKSPEQFKAVIGELNDLLHSKRTALEDGYKQGMGPTPLPKEFSAQSEHAKKSFDAVSDWALGGKSPSAPAKGKTGVTSNGLKWGVQ